MTMSVISQWCNPTLMGITSLIVVLETLVIIVQQVLLHIRGMKPL